MNILEISKELRSGKRVRRKCWYPDDSYVKRNGFDDHIVNKDNGTYALSSDELSATDWEVVEEKSPMELAWDAIQRLIDVHPSITVFPRTIFEIAWKEAERYFNSQK